MPKKSLSPFDSVEDVLADIASGKMVIVTDDESRENEGDLVMAASKVTPEAINHMILHGRGLICSPLLPNQLGDWEFQAWCRTIVRLKRRILLFRLMLLTVSQQELVLLIDQEP